MFVDFINKVITHNRDRAGAFGIRTVVHVPIGFIMGVLSAIPFLGYGLVQLFLKYERNEDAHTEDEAWKDIFGAIVGYSIGALCVFGAIVYLLKRILFEN